MSQQVMKAKAQSVQEIRKLRKKVEEQLFKLPNVIGSMIGVKIQSGELTKKIGLTIFVSEKITPPEQLGPGEKIQSPIIVNGRPVHTDVVEIRPLRPQAFFFPGAPIVCDGFKNGMVSSFCRSPHGFFGLTCAHVVGGKDKDPATSDPVEIWSEATTRYIQVGKTLYAIVASGAGIPGNFGFTDAALFTLEHPELFERARKAAVIQAADPQLGEIVQGTAATQRTITGRVVGLEKNVRGMLVDVSIKVDPPGTFCGDSGMLWKNQEGKPVAIHAYGEETPPQIGSSLTGAMLAGRAAKSLRVKFLNEP